MASSLQRAAAKRNIKKAARAAQKKRTIAHLPKSTRTALGSKARSLRRKRGAIALSAFASSSARVAGAFA